MQLPSEGAVERVAGCLDHSLDPEEVERCDADISLQEVCDGIHGLRRGKSPGADGISAEFFQFFADLLTPILRGLFSAMQAEDRCAESFVGGLITLVLKNKGSRADLGNYRPISLLNADYKILARILGARLWSGMSTIIGPNQTYGVPGRDIADSILSIRSSYENVMTDGGIFLSLDLEKAFDRVDHNSFLHASFCIWARIQ